jgi:hypothetical protein
MRRLAFAAVAMAALVGVAAPAGAAGYRGASVCSGAGAPTGQMPVAFGNPGEAISFTARVVGHDGTFHPGPIVALNCNPRYR